MCGSFFCAMPTTSSTWTQEELLQTVGEEWTDEETRLLTNVRLIFLLFITNAFNRVGIFSTFLRIMTT
jgi:hypothetical protein